MLTPKRRAECMSRVRTVREQEENLPAILFPTTEFINMAHESRTDLPDYEQALSEAETRIEELNNQVTAAANLLARIHRDGGYSIDKVGWQQACLDAEEVVLRIRLQPNLAACPCLHTTPCHPRCTCVSPFSSHGCARCCSYGSKEQQVDQAEKLAAAQPHKDPNDDLQDPHIMIFYMGDMRWPT